MGDAVTKRTSLYAHVDNGSRLFFNTKRRRADLPDLGRPHMHKNTSALRKATPLAAAADPAADNMSYMYV